MNFIAQHNKLMYSLVFSLTIMGYVFNTKKQFVNFHITNAAAAIAFLVIAWSILRSRKLKKLSPLLGIASFITCFEIIGFVVIRQNPDLMIADTPFWIILTSIIPCLFNIFILGLLEWFWIAEEKRLGSHSNRL